MRTKRVTRDRLETQAFFSQSPACTCHHCHGSHRAYCNLKAAAGISYTEISREISAATKALKAATICLDGACTVDKSDEPEVASQSEVSDTFELEELDEFVAQYDEVYEDCASIEEDLIDSIGEKAGAAMEEHDGAANVTTARVKAILHKQRRTNALIDSYICTVQFFNIDKKFNFIIEAFEAIARQHEARHGEESPPFALPTLTQKFNDPIGLLMDESKENREPRPRKHLDAETAMLSTKRLCVLAIKDIKAVNRAISDRDYHVTLIDNAATTLSRMPASIPEYIRQAISDFEFLYVEIVNLREKTMWLRDQIRCTMIIWMGTSREAWEYGKTHIYEFPDMRRYEYQRISLGALYTVWLREEAKIFRYCASHGGLQSLGLKMPKLEEALEVRNLGWEGVERDWESSSQKLKTFISSVEDMVKQLEGVDNEVDVEMGDREDDWWKVFMPAHKES